MDEKQTLIISGLLLAVIISAVSVVYSKHESRTAFVKLQALLSEKDRMDVYWGKLQLEQGAWTAHGRIENDAEKLGMITPDSTEIIVVKP